MTEPTHVNPTMHSATPKVLVTGGSGFLGKALIPALKAAGWHPIIVSRSKRDASTVVWDIARHKFDPSALNEITAVIHLSGENIAGKRWTPQVKDAIRESRINSTELLVQTIQQSGNIPRVLISASAIGIYGDTGKTIVDESAPAGTGFLPELALAWEGAARRLESETRVVLTRFGILLSEKGGALQKMLPAFRWGLGGVIGNGSQWMSWIALEDAVGAIIFALENEKVIGPLNVTAPQPATNREFTKTLGRVLRRPTILPLPAAAVTVLFGEMGEKLLLASSGVKPTKLLELGFQHRYPDLRSALKAGLRKR